jgi:class 3 adenylate cyclase
MSTDEPEFAVELDVDGKPKVVRRNGQEIALGGNQDFCDFLTWATDKRPLEAGKYRSELKSHYFADRDRLVDFCKKNGVMLAAIHWPEHAKLLAMNPVQVGGVTFRPLFQCHMARGQSINPVADGITAGTAPIACATQALLETLVNEMQDDRSEVRKICSWPVERCFVYFDVSDFSKFPPGQQALVIDTIIHIVQHQPFWTADIFRCFEAMLCIGDGYIFVIRDAVQATRFAANLAHVVETVVAKGEMPVDFHFRMGVHSGPVYSFWDVGRNGWNYAGTGINGGNRVLSAIGKDTDDVLFVSDAVRQQIMASTIKTARSLIEHMQNRGRRADKHGNLWRVYEVNHTSAAPLPPDLQ